MSSRTTSGPTRPRRSSSAPPGTARTTCRNSASPMVRARPKWSRTGMASSGSSWACSWSTSWCKESSARALGSWRSACASSRPMVDRPGSAPRSLGRSAGSSTRSRVELPIIGGVAMFASTGHRRVGDMIAGTYVVPQQLMGNPVILPGQPGYGQFPSPSYGAPTPGPYGGPPPGQFGPPPGQFGPPPGQFGAPPGRSAHPDHRSRRRPGCGVSHDPQPLGAHLLAAADAAGAGFLDPPTTRPTCRPGTPSATPTSSTTPHGRPGSSSTSAVSSGSPSAPDGPPPVARQ